MANASTTEGAEIFLKDLTSWGKEAFGFRELRSDTRALYLSQVIIDFNSSPNALLSSFTLLSEALGELRQGTYGLEAQMQFSGVGLNYDRTATSIYWQNLVNFSVERRVNQPFSRNRFFSEAPLNTEDHLRFLQLIDPP